MESKSKFFNCSSSRVFFHGGDHLSFPNRWFLVAPKHFFVLHSTCPNFLSQIQSVRPPGNRGQRGRMKQKTCWLKLSLIASSTLRSFEHPWGEINDHVDRWKWPTCLMLHLCLFFCPFAISSFLLFCQLIFHCTGILMVWLSIDYFFAQPISSSLYPLFQACAILKNCTKCDIIIGVARSENAVHFFTNCCSTSCNFPAWVLFAELALGVFDLGRPHNNGTTAGNII